MAFKIIATLVILTVSLEMSSGSAIPIWEFLSRNEKMSYLYSTFAKLVSDHCKTNTDTRIVPVNHCKRDLLNYGYEKLQTFADHQLDTLDPYQRGANELIWTTIMRGHSAAAFIPTRHQQQTSTVASLLVPQMRTASNKPIYPKNPLFDESERKHTYAMDMDIAYGHTPAQTSGEDSYALHQSPSTSSYKQPTYLSGPFVFRVRPDGTPIEGDSNKPYPRDDDLEAYQFAKQSNNKQKRLSNLASSQHLTYQQVAAAQQQRTRRQSKPYSGLNTPYYSRRVVHV